MFQKIKITPLAVALALTVMIGANSAWAGQGCSMTAQSVDYVVKAVSAAGRLQAHLNASGRDLAIIARQGSDITEHGLKYTHGAIVRKRKDTGFPEGQWVVTHLLNTCGTNKSFLTNQGLFEFMMDDLLTFDTFVALPSDGLVRELDRVIESGAAKQLYNPAYSMISNPLGPLMFQNSNHWLLDVIAQAQRQMTGEQAVDRALTQEMFKAKGYQPSTISISAFERFGAGFTRANVRFDDHPERALAKGKYGVVSVKSIGEYLKSTNMLHGPIAHLK